MSWQPPSPNPKKKGERSTSIESLGLRHSWLDEKPSSQKLGCLKLQMLQHLKYWLALRSCGIHYTVGVWKCMGNDSVPQLMKSSVWKLQTCLCFWQQYALNIYFMTQFFWWVFTIFNSCSCLVADRLIYLCVCLCVSYGCYTFVFET